MAFSSEDQEQSRNADAGHGNKMPSLEDIMGGGDWNERLRLARQRRQTATPKSDRPGAQDDEQLRHLKADPSVPSAEDIAGTMNYSEKIAKAERRHQQIIAERQKKLGLDGATATAATQKSTVRETFRSVRTPVPAANENAEPAVGVAEDPRRRRGALILVGGVAAMLAAGFVWMQRNAPDTQVAEVDPASASSENAAAENEAVAAAAVQNPLTPDVLAPAAFADAPVRWQSEPLETPDVNAGAPRVRRAGVLEFTAAAPLPALTGETSLSVETASFTFTSLTPVLRPDRTTDETTAATDVTEVAALGPKFISVTAPDQGPGTNLFDDGGDAVIGFGLLDTPPTDKLFSGGETETIRLAAATPGSAPLSLPQPLSRDLSASALPGQDISVSPALASPALIDGAGVETGTALTALQPADVTSRSGGSGMTELQPDGTSAGLTGLAVGPVAGEDFAILAGLEPPQTLPLVTQTPSPGDDPVQLAALSVLNNVALDSAGFDTAPPEEFDDVIALRATAPINVQFFAPNALAQATVAEKQASLLATGYVINEPKAVSITISRDQVRYFFAEDAKAAGLLAESIGAQLRDFTDFSPPPPDGTIEIWLAGRPVVARAAPRRQARPSQNASVNALRNRILQRLRSANN